MVGTSRGFPGCTGATLISSSNPVSTTQPLISLIVADQKTLFCFCSIRVIRENPWPKFLEQANGFGLLDRRYFSKFGKHFRGHASIHVNYGNRLPRRAWLPIADPAAQG